MLVFLPSIPHDLADAGCSLGSDLKRLSSRKDEKNGKFLHLLRQILACDFP